MFEKEKKVAVTTEEKTEAACCLEGLIEETEKRNATPEVVGDFSVQELCCGTWGEICRGQITKDHNNNLTFSFSLGDDYSLGYAMGSFSNGTIRIR